MGAGGIGMSALAGIALKKGYTVSGCDRAENSQTSMLRQLGADIIIGHSPDHVTGADRLIYTSAVDSQHPELVAAGERKLKRGAFLAELISQMRGVGICGTHGKTTTTWMLSHILIESGFDPTVLVGGEVLGLNGNFRVGGEIFVSELDESDGSFLLPDIEVGAITNIESEHLAYYGTLEKVVESFHAFSEKTTGNLSLNLDCRYCGEIFTGRSAPKSGYGLDDCRGYHLRDIGCERQMQVGRLYSGDEFLGDFALPFMGRHNLYNALCALSVSFSLGVKPHQALKALSSCVTVGRRMELLGEVAGVSFYSDYAHHPTEVQAAISALGQMGGGKGLVVFQPHLFSRTRDYSAEFAEVLSGADGVMLGEIYPAREEEIPGVSSELIARALCGAEYGGLYATAQLAAGVEKFIAAHGEYDKVVFMGAGDIDKIGRYFIAACMSQENG